MINIRKHISFLAILLIPVYLLVLKSSIRNTHTHVLPNGVIIVHSHPFTDAKTGLPLKHSHSQNQILFYQLFAFDFFNSAPETVLPETFSAVESELISFFTRQVPVGCSQAVLVRGPPLC
jgi:hypothetical protein